MIHRLFVEKRAPFRQHAHALAEDLKHSLDLPQLSELRFFVRYDVEGASPAHWPSIVSGVFTEAPIEEAYEETLPEIPGARVFAIEYLPGQYDQRADSAAQCIELITGERPVVATADVYALFGAITDEDLRRLETYLINAVDSRKAGMEKPSTLTPAPHKPAPVERLRGFLSADASRLAEWHTELGLAMSLEDLAFCQDYFAGTEDRDPSLTEIRLLDTYWSDHCRHTTFLSELTDVTFEKSASTAPIEAAWKRYRAIREELYGTGTDRPECLMDIAIIGMKWLRQNGKLDDLEVSAEINAASLIVPVEIDDRTEEWLIMFKNETHNHPTEIEPFGGAATCLGGAIRDPLSGRSYVYQAMRLTGAADPRTPYAETLPGKLPQSKICREAAHGYSSYGNQIGLATGLVREIYHPGYVAKRLEIGAVVAAAPRSHVRREEPAPGDVIILVGGPTGRDGIGGATGSSKAHDSKALDNAAEVQKGDPVCERKLQRLFRRKDVAQLIKRCNDFGAGGVSVAIGELADSLEINLDAVPKKYDGLDGTELAISESQERMAVVLAPEDAEAFQVAAHEENLQASLVARVTDSGRLRMTWQGDTVVDLSREFLDSNGVRQTHTASVKGPDLDASPLRPQPPQTGIIEHWLATLSDLQNASQKGLIERFDSTIGAASVLHPLGGKTRFTPADSMAALVPMLEGTTRTATVMSFGLDPYVCAWSPFHGARIAILHAVTRVVATGGDRSRTRLSLQEFFERLHDEPERWGKPLAALLGALEAQEALETAAVGGKDSMSGTFKNLDVPPTLAAFAIAPTGVADLRSPELKGAGNALVHIALPRDSAGLPDLKAAALILDEVAGVIKTGKVLSSRAIGAGGIATALAEMAFGNEIGAAVDPEALPAATFFQPLYGDILLETADGFEAPSDAFKVIGRTLSEPILCHGSAKLALADARSAWEAPLEAIYPTRTATPSGRPHEVRFEPRETAKAKTRLGRPKVVLPVFPGTNCEFDSVRAFEAAGAEVETVLFRNLHPADVADSIKRLARAINQAQILFLPGGFSAGDEPAGSGKFIAAAFRHPALTDATMSLLKNRDGLALGICNGFQALIKLGLLPFGDIRPQVAGAPTLTHNLLQRHVSCYARTKVVSRQSPWLAECPLGEEYIIAMSHGEGRFVADESCVRHLIANDQIATQYINDAGKPTLELPFNPNGSLHAIEGLTSPCGRVFGKMGHSERAGPFIGINIPGKKTQPIFSAGVNYFR